MARKVTIAIAGDVMLGRLVNETIHQKGFAHPWGEIVPALRKVDLFLINLECALTAETRPWQDGEYKTFYFRAEPSAVETLKAGRVDFASVANNHICDFGTDGLLETLAILDRADIAHAGAGESLAVAREPARLNVNGFRINVVAFSDHPRGWAATPTSPGFNYTPVSVDAEDFRIVESTLAAARQDADLVIFSIHWGPNMRERPTEKFRAFARKVVGSGADIFWGHSAHLIQGIDVHEGKLILYDTGDFVDDYAIDPMLRNDLSALFLVRIAPPNHVEGIELVPVQIEDMQVNLAAGQERDWVNQRLKQLCDEMGTELRSGVGGLLAASSSESVEGD